MSPCVLPFPVHCRTSALDVLTQEAFLKRGQHYVTHFASTATVSVPVPATIIGLFNTQRQDWNGDLFNAVKFIGTMPRRLLQRSSRSPVRIFALLVQYLFTIFRLATSWLSLGLYFITLYVVTTTYLTPQRYDIADAARYLIYTAFAGTVVGQVIADVSLPVTSLRIVYITAAWIHGLMAALATYMVARMCYDGTLPIMGVYAAGATVAMCAALAALHLRLFPMIQTFVQFVVMSPVYYVMVPLHAVSRCDDYTIDDRDEVVAATADCWNPVRNRQLLPLDRGSGRGDALTGAAYETACDTALAVRWRFVAFKVRVLGLLLVCNWILVSGVLYYDSSFTVLWGLAAIVTVSLAFAWLGSSLYLVVSVLTWLAYTVARVMCGVSPKLVTAEEAKAAARAGKDRRSSRKSTSTVVPTTAGTGHDNDKDNNAWRDGRSSDGRSTRNDSDVDSRRRSGPLPPLTAAVQGRSQSVILQQTHSGSNGNNSGRAAGLLANQKSARKVSAGSVRGTMLLQAVASRGDHAIASTDDAQSRWHQGVGDMRQEEVDTIIGKEHLTSAAQPAHAVPPRHATDGVRTPPVVPGPGVASRASGFVCALMRACSVLAAVVVACDLTRHWCSCLYCVSAVTVGQEEQRSTGRRHRPRRQPAHPATRRSDAWTQQQPIGRPDFRPRVDPGVAVGAVSAWYRQQRSCG